MKKTFIISILTVFMLCVSNNANAQFGSIKKIAREKVDKAKSQAEAKVNDAKSAAQSKAAEAKSQAATVKKTSLSKSLKR